ncbi:hypothetical protein WBJ53_29620 [Spirosoma sp. SC4-14]|uniref:hypothetical protein n=1 Tax=Spirosoma sp. SC4-14 TaxID=3128900 RepID=UPI0030D0A303
MAIVDFTAVNPNGICRDQSYIDQDIESCFEILSLLVRHGWQLISARVFMDHTETGLTLPVEAFDGLPIREPIRLLLREWE